MLCDIFLMSLFAVLQIGVGLLLCSSIFLLVLFLLFVNSNAAHSSHYAQRVRIIFITISSRHLLSILCSGTSCKVAHHVFSSSVSLGTTFPMIVWLLFVLTNICIVSPSRPSCSSVTHRASLFRLARSFSTISWAHLSGSSPSPSSSLGLVHAHDVPAKNNASSSLQHLLLHRPWMRGLLFSCLRLRLPPPLISLVLPTIRLRIAIETRYFPCGPLLLELETKTRWGFRSFVLFTLLTMGTLDLPVSTPEQSNTLPRKLHLLNILVFRWNQYPLRNGMVHCSCPLSAELNFLVRRTCLCTWRISTVFWIFGWSAPISATPQRRRPSVLHHICCQQRCDSAVML